jgi:hypothetical protein
MSERRRSILILYSCHSRSGMPGVQFRMLAISASVYDRSSIAFMSSRNRVELSRSLYKGGGRMLDSPQISCSSDGRCEEVAIKEGFSSVGRRFSDRERMTDRLKLYMCQRL